MEGMQNHFCRTSELNGRSAFLCYLARVVLKLFVFAKIVRCLTSRYKKGCETRSNEQKKDSNVSVVDDEIMSISVRTSLMMPGRPAADAL